MDPEPGEEVYYHGHPSWLALIGLYAKGLFVSIAAGASAGVVTAVVVGHVQVGWVIVAVLVCYVVTIIAGLMFRIRTTYTITDRRLTIDIGLVAHEVHETRLERVQNVNSKQSVLQRMLGIGTVDFDTAGGAEFDFAFRGVAHPHKIVRTVDNALQRLIRGQAGV
jgi:uncharacterized membrane protein YdbT with pleckstrin-like domain